MAVSDLMHLAAGSTAKQLNLRKDRTGAMWQKPYQCTLVEDGRHLFNCLCYVDLNMVRAGVVTHPKDWRWCGYHELMGIRKRYRLLNPDRLLESLEIANLSAFRGLYEEAIARRIREKQLAREAHWTESLAVGSQTFVEDAKQHYSSRLRFDVEGSCGGSDSTWTLRESREPYGPE